MPLLNPTRRLEPTATARDQNVAERSLAKKVRFRRAQRTEYGRARWKVMSLKLPFSALEKALEIYDPGLVLESMTTVDRLAEALGLEGIDWPSQKDKLAIVDEKFDKTLMKALFVLGYRHFTFYGQNGRGFLKIAPKEGESPPVLPKFLQIPYLVPAQGYTFRWRPESFRSNPIVETGAPLLEVDGESLERLHGTLGPIMSSPLPGTQSGLVFVSLTAAHVIPDGASHLAVQHPTNASSYIQLEVPHFSKRLQGRRAAHGEDIPPFFDDLGFLVISPNDIKYFARSYYNINTHLLDQCAGPQEMLLDPLARDRYSKLKKVLCRSSVIVFKKGSQTDQTMGHLVDVTLEPPEGWYEWAAAPKGSDESFEDSRLDLSSSGSSVEETSGWLGMVQWSTVPFAAPGDSGSLVFAVESGILVPLGVHVGSPESSPNHSVFISLEAFCLEGERQG